MHYILKLPGTIATVVNYPTSSPAYADVNAASLEVCRINTQGLYGFSQSTVYA